MADERQTTSKLWWVALGIAIGLLLGSPRLTVRITQCDSPAAHQAGDGEERT